MTEAPSREIAAAVVVVSHRSAPTLERVLTALAESTSPGTLRELVVVLNGGRRTLESRTAWTVSLPTPRVLVEPTGIKSRALNLALATLESDLVLFLDDDVRMERGWAASYVAAARRRGRGFYFGGSTSCDYEVPPPIWLRPFLPPSAAGLEFQDLEVVLPTGSLFLGFNWAAYAEDLRAAEGFDPRLGPGTRIGVGEESDLQRRLGAAGIQALHVPASRVWHHVPRGKCSPRWVITRHRAGAYWEGLQAAKLDGDAYGRGIARALRRSVLYYQPPGFGRPRTWWSREGRFFLRSALARMTGFTLGFARGRMK